MFANSHKPGFTFKQFHVAHERCAMKVGTDGILLGAWLAKQPAQRILDIGSGSGLISLMLAQNNRLASIDAIDIDADAVEQCADNFKHCPWHQRLRAYQCSLQQYCVPEYSQSKELGMPQTGGESAAYDLLVSNPPFFEATHATSSLARHHARQDSSLDSDALFEHCTRLSHQQSALAIVFPSASLAKLTTAATSWGWSLHQRMDIYTKRAGPAHRSLILWKRDDCVQAQVESLYLHQESGAYSAQFIQLCQDFYLKM